MPRKISRTTLRNKLDKICREKTRAIGKCMVCGNTETLQTHHVIGRRNLQVRWYIDNLVCLCSLHHTFGIKSAHQDPTWFTDWYKDHIGEERYTELRRRANLTDKIYDHDLMTLLEEWEAM